MEKLKLKAISFVDFRYSEATLFQQWAKRNKQTLRSGEAVLFVSHTRTQLIFVTGNSATGSIHAGQQQRIVDSRRWRLTNGVWSPEMLQNYAHQVGLHLIGIRSFEEIMEERTEKARKESAARAKAALRAAA